VSPIVYSRDKPFFRPWATAIGKLVLNFGSLEYETLEWLVQMLEAPERVSKFAGLTFVQRTDVVKRLIGDRAFAGTWKAASLQRWEEGKQIATIRNRLVHNPLVFGWSGNAEEGAPDYMDVPNVREALELAEPRPAPITLVSIGKATDRAASLVEELARLRKEWCALRDADLARDEE